MASHESHTYRWLPAVKAFDYFMNPESFTATEQTINFQIVTEGSVIRPKRAGRSRVEIFN